MEWFINAKRIQPINWLKNINFSAKKTEKKCVTNFFLLKCNKNEHYVWHCSETGNI